MPLDSGEMPLDDSPDWLPAGWTVQVKPKDGRKIKCYIDPESGRKFYSKPQVFNYIKERTPNGNNSFVIRSSGRKYFSKQELSRHVEAVSDTGSEKRHDGDHVPGGSADPDMSIDGSSESLAHVWVVGSRAQEAARRDEVVTPDGVDCTNRGGCPAEPDASQRKSAPQWLPDGWIMELKTRGSGSSAGTKYKLYVDPESGRRFFSKPQVLNYLATKNRNMGSEGINVGHNISKKQEVRNSKLANAKVISRVPADGLPTGWIKETRLREHSHTSTKDPYYIDLESRYEFRSKLDALRYLETGDISKCAIRPKKWDGNVNEEISELATSTLTGTGSSAMTSRNRRKGKGVRTTRNVEWDEPTQLRFIELCEDEIKKGNRLEDGLENMAQELSKMTNGYYDKRRLKNRLDKMKVEYKLWLQLNREEPELGWDDRKNNFNVGDEWWDRKVQENKDYASFREKDLKLIKEKYPLLFDGTTTEEQAWALRLRRRPPSSKRSSLYLFDDNEDMEMGDSFDTGSALRVKRRLVQGQNSSRKEGKIAASESLQTQIDSLIQVMKGIGSAASVHPKHATVDDCMNLLKEVVQPTTRFWNFACNLLTKVDNRDVFMKQPNAEARLSWLEYNYSLTAPPSPPFPSNPE